MKTEISPATYHVSLLAGDGSTPASALIQAVKE
jgi:hypothetical protein